MWSLFSLIFQDGPSYALVFKTLDSYKQCAPSPLKNSQLMSHMCRLIKLKSTQEMRWSLLWGFTQKMGCSLQFNKSCAIPLKPITPLGYALVSKTCDLTEAYAGH